jgi:uncharacterized repeat protein (TIGR01451 family)
VTANSASNNVSVLLNQGGADLAITKTSGPDPVIAGNDLTYTITVTNNGPSHATNVLVTDSLPSEVSYVSHSTAAGTASHDGSPTNGTVAWNVGNLTNGSSATLTITVDVLSSTADGTTITNTATVSGNETDPVSENNSTSEDTLVIRESDLAITKVDSPDPVVAGTKLKYTLTVTNYGPSDDTGVLVTDTPPSGDIASITLGTPSQGTATELGGVVSWDVGNLGMGTSAQLTITVKVKSSSTGTIINTATISGLETDPITGDNTATQETEVSPPGAVPGISFWGSVALAVLFSAMLIWLIRRRLIREGRTH